MKTNSPGCVAEMCSSRFSGCPDDVVPGSHNELGHVQANYHTCTCACCHPDFSSGAAEACTDVEYLNFDADTKAHCTPEMCSSRYSACPDDVVPGSHNELGVLEAMWHPEIAAMHAAAAARWPGPVGTNCECECCHPDFSSGTAEACTVYQCEQLQSKLHTCISSAVASCWLRLRLEARADRYMTLGVFACRFLL
eukprot:SAG22_NODE_693_length_7872_cov_13.111797_4_plen_195_part_00